MENTLLVRGHCGSGRGFRQVGTPSGTSELKLVIGFVRRSRSSNLVDPASSHTLVSKIKPCMSKYKRFYTVKLRMAHYISYSLFDSTLLLG